MSLPDTIFIFVLALIIFGPKKLPEIGRQLGKLVGEFRRASNEFKFQIEEELRQVDLADKREKQKTIAPPVPEETTTPSELAATSDPAENLPVGQHPNIDSVNTAELEEYVPPFGYSSSEEDIPLPENFSEDSTKATAQPTEEEQPLTVTPASGSQPRTSLPFTAVETDPSPESSVPLNSHRAATEAEITHG